jgi:RHS repeat-associated protein
MFQGQREVSGLGGLYHFGARFYLGKLGRFISADTIVSSLANPQSLNRYAFVLNNPLKYTDPTGHTSVCGFSYSDPECEGNYTPTRRPTRPVANGGGYQYVPDAGVDNTPAPLPAGGGLESGLNIPVDVCIGGCEREVILGSGGSSCRMDPCFKNDVLADVFNDLSNILDLVGEVLSTVQLGMATGGCLAGARFGGAKGCAAGYTLAQRFYVSFTPIDDWENLAGLAAILTTSASDFFGDRTGYDPRMGIVIGGDTGVELATALLGMQNDPIADFGLSSVQLMYDFYREFGYQTFEVRIPTNQSQFQNWSFFALAPK